jgi:hypothetical protein
MERIAELKLIVAQLPCTITSTQVGSTSTVLERELTQTDRVRMALVPVQALIILAETTVEKVK